VKAQYTVIWWQPALDDLTTLWIDFTDREAINSATDEIDRILASAPATAGIDFHEGLRKLTIEPLEVQFSIDEADRKVTIWSTRRTR
jgi:hypothetical protein